MAVPRWTTAQFGNELLARLLDDLVLPLHGRREHVLDVDVGDRLARRDGDLAADRAPDVGVGRGAARWGCCAAALAARLRARGAARRRRCGWRRRARPRRRGLGLRLGRGAAEVLERLASAARPAGDRTRRPRRSPCAGPGPAPAAAGPRAAAPPPPTTPPPTRRAARPSGSRRMRRPVPSLLSVCSQGSSVSSSCVDDQDQKHQRAERDRAPDEKQQRSARARTGGGRARARRAAPPWRPRRCARRAPGGCGRRRNLLGPVDHPPGRAQRLVELRARPRCSRSTRSPMNSAPVTPSDVPDGRELAAPQRQPLHQQRRRLIARADRRDADDLDLVGQRPDVRGRAIETRP